jgi:hypothetical protein
LNMSDPNNRGAFGTDGLDAGPEQGGSNLGGLGATGATDRDRDIDAEGGVTPTPHTAREHELERGRESGNPQRAEGLDEDHPGGHPRPNTPGSRLEDQADQPGVTSGGESQGGPYAGQEKVEAARRSDDEEFEGGQSERPYHGTGQLGDRRTGEQPNSGSRD